MPIDLITVEGQRVKHIAKYEVEWIDITGGDEELRNAVGTLRLNYVNQKYKLILTTPHLYESSIKEIFDLFPLRSFSVTYWNPYTKSFKTGNFYRGNRKVSAIRNPKNNLVYEPFSFGIIEL